MISLIGLIWFLLVLITPLFLFISSNNNQKNETDGVKIIGKLALSIVAHFVISIFFGLILLLFYVGPEPRPVEKMGEIEKIIILLTLVVYILVIWLLCSFVNGGLIKSFDLLGFKKEKVLSVFDKD